MFVGCCNTVHYVSDLMVMQLSAVAEGLYSVPGLTSAKKNYLKGPIIQQKLKLDNLEERKKIIIIYIQMFLEEKNSFGVAKNLPKKFKQLCPMI